MKIFALLAVWITFIVQAANAAKVLTCTGNSYNTVDGLLVDYNLEIHGDTVSFSGLFKKPDNWYGYIFAVSDVDGNHQFRDFQAPSEVTYYGNQPYDKRGILQNSYFRFGRSAFPLAFNIVPTQGARPISVDFYSADLRASRLPLRFSLACNYVEQSVSSSHSSSETQSSSSAEESSSETSSFSSEEESSSETSSFSSEEESSSEVSSSSDEEESSSDSSSFSSEEESSSEASSSSSEEESSSDSSSFSSEEESSSEDLSFNSETASSSSDEESGSSIESSSPSHVSSTESTSSSESSTSSTSSSESSSVSATPPTVTGFLQAGVPVFELTIPGSLGPWSSVTLSGGASGFVFHSGQYDVDGVPFDQQLNLDDLPTFTSDIDDSIDLAQSLIFVIDTIATTTGPFTFRGTVRITTEDPVQFYQKREDLSWDLEFTINGDISSSSSSIQSSSSVQSSTQSSSSVEISLSSQSSSISPSTSSSLSSSTGPISSSISSFITVSSSSFAGYNSSTNSFSPASSFDTTSVPSKTADISVVTLTDTHSILHTLTVTVPCETVTTTNPAGKTVTQVITKVCTTDSKGEIITSTRKSELVLSTLTNLVGSKTTVTLAVPCSYCAASKGTRASTETNASAIKPTATIGSIVIPTNTVTSTGTVVTTTNAVVFTFTGTVAASSNAVVSTFTNTVVTSSSAAVSTFTGAGTVLASGLGLSGIVAFLFAL